VPHEFFTLLLWLPQFLAYFADYFFRTGIPASKAAPLTKTLMRKISFYSNSFFFLDHDSFITIFILLQKPDSLKRLLVNLELAENTIHQSVI